ncbi:spherulation-specific family 4 protein [Thermococcus sp.]|uniref:spherulation-specific family 4 protein n=1 Tax=Thermococcus sp. TaxID=35749 RepID=UPI00262F7CDF|nr:spherulation-specific family 4 protein [Thermococcus sp.]
MRKILSGTLVLLLLVSLLAVHHLASGGSSESNVLLIPLYVYPGCQWDSLIQVKTLYPSISVIIIANPANGPGASEDSTYKEYIQKMRDNGIGVLGYVWTDYGHRDISDVENDIDNWVNWYNVSGIFLDGVNVSSADESYYQTLVDYIHNKSSSFLAVGNPGSYDPDTLDAELNIFDVLVIYDSPGYPESWPSANTSKLGALVYNVSSFNSGDFADLMGEAKYLYVTDGNAPNPWGRLSSYLVDEVAAITGEAKTDYVLRVSSHNTTGYSVVEHYITYNLSAGLYNLTYAITLKNWNSSGAGVDPMYVYVNDSGNADSYAYFTWTNGYNGIALYSCYYDGSTTDCRDLDYNVTDGWHNLTITVNKTEIGFYVDGSSVWNVTSRDITEVLRSGAGSWDKTAQYDLYIDNVTERDGSSTVVGENFDDDYDCYFTEHVGDVAVVPASDVPVPFFGSALAVLLGISLLILTMRRR